MTDTEITAAMKRVLAGIAPEADVDALDPHDDLREELELDSIDALHFLVGLHKELNVDIPEADYGKLTTKAAIIDYVKKTAPQANRTAE
jgi:acyl carrier protein